MKIENPLKNAPFETLPKPFATQPRADGMQISPSVKNLVQSQVRALVESSPNFHHLSAEQKQGMYRDLCKINAYTAALVQEDWALSKKLGQTPILHEQTIFKPLALAVGGNANDLASAPVARAAADPPPAAEEFSPRAASQVAKITRETLNAIAFPTFVADLIKGTFQAIVNASIQQMEAYGNLLANVAKTVDQFMGDNITDNQARDYLTSRYPSHFKVETSENAARVRAKDTDMPPPDFKTDLGISQDVSIDDDAAEEVLVPAARRKLAQQRHSMLSTMVLMGINRIVVTSGRIKASMGFRIDAKDHAKAETASQFDMVNESTMKTGFGGGIGSFFGGPSAEFENKNTVTYVSSTKKDSSDELDVHADLTGEVELKFKSDYFPMERLANPQMMSLIQGNTPNPAANTPNAGTNTAKEAPGGTAVVG
ncbi:MAG: hypothetical protein H7070_01690 [Saprospiraceae bacterium]|nr:hypothetical protein [Pyrinomonadaceae bacterium]